MESQRTKHITNEYLSNKIADARAAALWWDEHCEATGDYIDGPNAHAVDMDNLIKKRQLMLDAVKFIEAEMKSEHSFDFAFRKMLLTDKKFQRVDLHYLNNLFISICDFIHSIVFVTSMILIYLKKLRITKLTLTIMNRAYFSH